ncbi:5'-3' exoribonuclease D [Novymonas esmeraldas]|uniref:5'-3' exoribonuclease D n=1 Tax=Novymonas esmeraldas TaxID=1808958 RepID=A0AAW0F019_9TRYP
MGIAGFFLWLQRWYGDCVDYVPQDVVDAAFKGHALPQSYTSAYSYDNFYVDMNGLIHPCCHDTAPLPEPETEEEMFERMFGQLDLLVRVVRPKKCLVLCIDGVAPRSKMNQQRSRRFRAADERLESDAISNACADLIVAELRLPRPRVRERWDHNVITPSTAFMERVALALEWFIMKKLNEDAEWRHLTVIFSDAHVPGEGEHKIMQYIRGLRSQPGYDSETTHVIHGMDADLICLGLSTHEKHVCILRNQLTDTFQPDHNRFCYFNLRTYREKLMKDFGNIAGMEFERVVDDFIFLCFFVGNDFLPHVPLVSIKTRGIEMLLDHYVRDFALHGYLTQLGEVDYAHLRTFLGNFVAKCMPKLTCEYYGVLRAKERAKQHVEERVTKTESLVPELLATLRPDGSNAQDVSDALLGLLSSVRKERARLVVDTQPLGFSYLDQSYRDAYYHHKFGWDPVMNRVAFENQICLCCAEYLRGMQWVMRYYTKGCPSWEWYFPYHYAPLLQDLAAFAATVDVEMRMSAPLHPVEQLLAVLPRLSVHALPEELHGAVNDPTSVLGKFYPSVVDVDFSEANFSYQGVLRIPFINCEALSTACRGLVELEEDFGSTFLYCHRSSRLAAQLDALTGPGNRALPLATGLAPSVAPIPVSIASKTPIAGRVGRYEAEWLRGEELRCPDPGIAKATGYGGAIKENHVNQYRYELNTQADYRPVLLGGEKRGRGAAAEKAKRPTAKTPSGKPGKDSSGAGPAATTERRPSRNDGRRQKKRARLLLQQLIAGGGQGATEEAAQKQHHAASHAPSSEQQSMHEGNTHHGGRSSPPDSKDTSSRARAKEKEKEGRDAAKREERKSVKVSIDVSSQRHSQRPHGGEE